MAKASIISVEPLQFPWQPPDPFLFCAYHNDHYPAGDEGMGVPEAARRGRRIGMDFSGKEGWSMYHGEHIPGFPMHPHRGFETITIARKGYIDHSDSLGATARFGNGDVQWMTAGNGVVHSEMFPLVHRDKENPTELFQIWLNLPASNKMADPHFKMLWADTVPQEVLVDEQGHKTTLTVIAGAYETLSVPKPPPHSWAAHEEADVAIWTLRMEPGATWTAPPGQAGSQRSFCFFAGQQITIAGQVIGSHAAIQVQPDASVTIQNGPKEAELLMLQGRPLNEPIAQRGPFVMNTQEQLFEAMRDYQQTGFGGWPWSSDSPVHPKESGRYARYPDGKEERP